MVKVLKSFAAHPYIVQRYRNNYEFMKHLNCDGNQANSSAVFQPIVA